MDIKKFRIKSGQKIRLDDWDPDETSSFDGDKKDALTEITKLKEKLERLQEKLFAEKKHKVLVVLQAMDTGGKDSTIRLVFEGVNPQGIRVIGFKAPTPEEKGHDFLWRVHKNVPQNGEIVIFNRSHYESVLIERVHKIVPDEVWKNRYSQINDFEKELSAENTLILKFYLHISKKEQRIRLEERLRDPTKEWKFSQSDLPERKFWKEYMKAYEEAIQKTSTSWAPWYIVPANHKWFRDCIIVNAIVTRMEELGLKYLKLDSATRTQSEAQLED